MFEKSVEVLNRVIADELTAIHQYMYWHFHCDDQGYDLLAGLFKRTAIDEMLHIERVAERILFLKGDVDITPAGPVEKITNPEDMVKKATAMEEGSATDYNKAALACGANADSASKQIFEGLVADEERHFNQFDQQLDNIKRFGPNYLALQFFSSPADAGGQAPA